jgi:hypothetical protein
MHTTKKKKKQDEDKVVEILIHVGPPLAKMEPETKHVSRILHRALF